MHRGWLIALALLVIFPWIIAGTIYLRFSAKAAAPLSTNRATERAAPPAGAGPWGQLSYKRVLISPPLEYVAANWGRKSGKDEWYFPGTSFEVMQAFLAYSGLSAEQVRRISATARPDPRTNGLIVTPDPEIVRSLTPQVRAQIYLELAKTVLNFDQANAFRFRGSTEEWLAGSAIAPQTRKLVEPLIFRDGDYLLFADPELVRAQVSETEELQRLAKTLLRQSTVLVRLNVADESAVPALADYWGRGGRRTDLRPLLESVAESAPEHSIDIVHLLPTFARNHLYRYPKLTAADFDRPLIVNCLWSSLNFFNAQPDDRYLDLKFALNALKRDYYLVEHDYQLGDIIVFLDANGNLIHAAVYLADNLTFSKNGTSPVAPWAIASVDELKGYYRSRSTNPTLMVHRRNDF